MTNNLTKLDMVRKLQDMRDYTKLRDALNNFLRDDTAYMLDRYYFSNDVICQVAINTIQRDTNNRFNDLDEEQIMQFVLFLMFVHCASLALYEAYVKKYANKDSEFSVNMWTSNGEVYSYFTALTEKIDGFTWYLSTIYVTFDENQDYHNYLNIPVYWMVRKDYIKGPGQSHYAETLATFANLYIKELNDALTSYGWW